MISTGKPKKPFIGHALSSASTEKDVNAGEPGSAVQQMLAVQTSPVAFHEVVNVAPVRTESIFEDRYNESPSGSEKVTSKQKLSPSQT